KKDDGGGDAQQDRERCAEGDRQAAPTALAHPERGLRGVMVRSGSSLLDRSVKGSKPRSRPADPGDAALPRPAVPILPSGILRISTASTASGVPSRTTSLKPSPTRRAGSRNDRPRSADCRLMAAC